MSGSCWRYGSRYEAFKTWLQDSDLPTQIVLRTDNMAVLQAVSELRSKSLMQLTAEINMQVELLQLLPMQATHVPGVLNKIADSLSRLSQGTTLPWQLQNAQQVQAPSRTANDFRAWP